jgi:hypothetical protein
MKYKLTILLLLALSTKSFSETYMFGGYEPIVVTVFGGSGSTVPSTPSFQGPDPESDKQVWLEFFRDYCDLTFENVEEMENSENLYCNGNHGNLNSVFPSVAGFTNLANISFVANNLTQVDSLSSLISVNSITLYSNDLTNVDGLWRLRTATGHVHLQYNDLLNVNGLSSLQTVGTYIYLSKNSYLQDLSGLNNLTNVGEFVLFDNRNYAVKMSSTSYLCQTGNEAKISGTAKTNVCEI